MTFGIGALGVVVVGYSAQRYESVAPVMYCIAASAVVMLFLILFALRARNNFTRHSGTDVDATEPGAVATTVAT